MVSEGHQPESMAVSVWRARVVLAALLVVAAAFRLGQRWGGLVSATVAGGLAAVLPLYVEHAAMPKPYADAWFLSLMAMYWAASRSGAWLVAGTGVLLGLAIASRIDMLLIVPL